MRFSCFTVAVDLSCSGSEFDLVFFPAFVAPSRLSTKDRVDVFTNIYWD